MTVAQQSAQHPVQQLPAPTTAQLEALATTEHLLVVSDFDGTLAGFNRDVMDVPITQKSIDALRDLAHLPNTTVGILSGRQLKDLYELCELRDPVILAGSHGAEVTYNDSLDLTDEQRATYQRLQTRLQELADSEEGIFLEVKPSHLVIHTVKIVDAEPERARAVEQKAMQIRHEEFADQEIAMLHGKNIVEFSLIDMDKGKRLAEMIERFHATAAVYLGDDVTDEDAFQALRPQDLGIKVGDGDTVASTRVHTLDDVAEVLSDIATRRAAHR